MRLVEIWFIFSKNDTDSSMRLRLRLKQRMRSFEPKGNVRTELYWGFKCMSKHASMQ